MQNIEVEVRSFIIKEQYQNLIKFLASNARYVKDDYQETYYFNAPTDLRIQRNNLGCKLWLKKGKIHDFCREEIEVKFSRDDFEKLENLLNALGFAVKIKWFRDRKQYDWNGIKVCVDFTKGYGHIIELEKMCEEHQKENVLDELKNKMSELGIEITPREEFDKKFKYYEDNWKELTK